MVVPVSINKQQLGLRLLELPPDVAELVESESAPTLLLKSSETSTHDVQNSGSAALCTSNKTFQIRQVQSSNVLYILQQTENSGYTAIAQCKGMLELVPSQENALAYIRQQLPVYTVEHTTPSNITRNVLSERTPFSEGEIEDVLTQLCVFEKGGGLWIPTVTDLRGVWNSLLTAATINGIKLDQLWNVRDMERQVKEDGISVELYRAVVRCLSDSQDLLETRLDAKRTTAWVGSILFGSEETIHKTDFIAQWQDQLPESWRGLANVEVLKDKYKISLDNLVSTLDHSKPLTDTKKTAPTSKSKWHQKFQQQK